MKDFLLEHAEVLYLRFCAIYGDKFVKSYHTEDFKSLWAVEWTTGLVGIDVSLIKGCLDYCKTTLEWPPSIAEFRRICEAADGLPSVDDALQLAIRRDFNHPVVSLAYSRVDSWALKNDKQEVLHGKFQKAYTEALSVFRSDPTKAWLALEVSKTVEALPPPPPKIPSQEECLGFLERLKLYQEKSKADKIAMGDKSHPEWPKDQLIVGSKSFNKEMFEERKQYLITLDEMVAGTLSNNDNYDRIRFLREIDASRHLDNVGYTGRQDEPVKASPRGYKSVKPIIRNWMRD